MIERVARVRWTWRRGRGGSSSGELLQSQSRGVEASWMYRMRPNELESPSTGCAEGHFGDNLLLW